ncbi:MAG: uncharacterized protein JWN98_2430, partial [Abditibacteriota bacterium]|nr:uncharacterized protein [Abditibacteriota bacterium]
MRTDNHSVSTFNCSSPLGPVPDSVSESAQSTLMPTSPTAAPPGRRLLTRRGFFKASLRTGIGLSAISLCSLGYASEIEPRRWSVSRYDLVLPRLPRAFEGYRVLHASDLHCDGEWMNRARLSQVIEVINREAADLIALTGDFVTHDARTQAPDAVWALKQFKARDGVYAVLGNHDHWSGLNIMQAAMREAGVRELPNAVHTLKRQSTDGRTAEAEMLHIAGVDDWWMKCADIKAVVRQLPDSGAAILLAHEPDFADISAATGRFDLQLSGHSHGGQVRVPGFGPLVLPAMAKKYHTGLYQLETPRGTMWQFTTRGLGVVGLHVRFSCPPEIAVLTLR